jgi:hypothetical protein
MQKKFKREMNYTCPLTVHLLCMYNTVSIYDILGKLLRAVESVVRLFQEIFYNYRYLQFKILEVDKL